MKLSGNICFVVFPFFSFFLSKLVDLLVFFIDKGTQFIVLGAIVGFFCLFFFGF